MFFFFFPFLLDDNVLLGNVLYSSAFEVFDEKIRAGYSGISRILTQIAQIELHTIFLTHM